MTATPTAPPTWRVVSFTAEPTPARASGSDPMIDSVAGLMVNAIPDAASAIRQPMSRNGVVWLTPPSVTSPTPTNVSPERDGELGADAVDDLGAER